MYWALLFMSLCQSNDAVSPCKVETVGNCPNTLDLWNAAAQRMNCSTDLCGSESVYHCLLTENLTQLVEVCTKPIILTGKSRLTLSSNFDDQAVIDLLQFDNLCFVSNIRSTVAMWSRCLGTCN